MCDKVMSGAVRDAARLPGFEHIGELLARERSLKLRRRNRKLVEVIGEQFFKVPELNKRAYFCITGDKDVDRFIEGLSEVASPPLSEPVSAKPSVKK